MYSSCTAYDVLISATEFRLFQIFYHETDQRGIEGASLQKANLKRANLKGTNLKNAQLKGAIMPDGSTYP
jgi:uncharacterized protein YjbI with pentapeptide repeats